MGFTRTSEGRVFFKGADNDDTPRFDAPPPADPVMNGDQTQMQILLLLKSLNTKLKGSKEEQIAMKKQLAAYKATLKHLKEKTASHESNYIDLEQQVARKQTEAQKQVTRVEETLKDTLKQLEEARKLVEDMEGTAEEGKETLETLKKEVDDRKKEEEKILKRQKDLEKAQAAQGEKMVDNVAAYVALTKRLSESETRQSALDNKIEETTSEYLKLDRKIDKAVEDRNRIMRKIERIEAAVMETRDALNAKAMVLLTQQGAASGVEYPHLTEEEAKQNPSLSQTFDAPPITSWWKKPVRLHSASLAGLLLLVLLLGWLVSAAFQSGSKTSDPAPADQKEIRTFSKSTESLPLKTTEDYQSRYAQNFEAEEPTSNTPEISEIPVSETSFETPEIKIHKGIPAEFTESEASKVNIRDEAEMLAMMDKEPEKVAQALNKIEPSSVPPTKTPEEVKAPPPPPVADKAYKAALQKKIKPDPNLKDVAKRIEAQAFEGIPEAQHDMGAIYVAGHGEIKQDIDRAILWFEEAANNGVANAKYNLGVLYHQGMGVKKDLDRALQLYHEAADLGHPEAQYNLGIANIEGIGVPYNPQKAARYFENAANKNITEAAYNLGLIYENGLLGETHPDEALMWYKTAADNGSPEAKAALEQLANSLGIAMSDVNLVVEKTRQAKRGSVPPAAQSNSQQFIISQIQNELMKRGLYPGPVDGMNGPMTANAIKTFQASASVAADGIPSQDLLNIMQSQTITQSWN